MLKDELDIINVFRKNLFEEDSIRGIMKKAKKKSYGRIFDSMQDLTRKGIIKTRKSGKSVLCSINLENALALSYLSLLDSNEANSRIRGKIAGNIAELMNSVPSDYFVFILTGSYAEGKATAKSDLDVVVIVEDTIDIRKILNTLKNKGELMTPEVHPYVFTKSEFLAMLLSGEMNYGKLIFKNRLIFFGAENYYRIIWRAIKNGFKG